MLLGYTPEHEKSDMVSFLLDFHRVHTKFSLESVVHHEPASDAREGRATG